MEAIKKKLYSKWSLITVLGYIFLSGPIGGAIVFIIENTYEYYNNIAYLFYIHLFFYAPLLKIFSIFEKTDFLVRFWQCFGWHVIMTA